MIRKLLLFVILLVGCHNRKEKKIDYPTQTVIIDPDSIIVGCGDGGCDTIKVKDDQRRHGNAY